MKLIQWLLIPLLLAVIPLSAQEKSRKERREEMKTARMQEVNSLMEAREFRFIPRSAQPAGRRTVDLTTRSGFVDFTPSLIESDMPYFGRAYAGAGMGGDSPMKFSGEPRTFAIEEKKKEFQLNTEVKSGSSNYQLFLTVNFSGSASLSVNSSNHSAISYHGEIAALKEE